MWLLSVCLFLTACQHRRAMQPIEGGYIVIIPQGCITSDVTCKVVQGQKKMDCNFDKFQKCEVIRATK